MGKFFVEPKVEIFKMEGFFRRRRLGVGRLPFKVGAQRVNGSRRFRGMKTRSRIRREVQRAIARKDGLELKFHDLDIDDPTVSATGTIAQVTCVDIDQGITESNRIGRKVRVKMINWRMTVRLIPGSAPANTSDTCRVILYLDKQANGATAGVTDILESADYQSFNNLANKGRFRTLMDKTWDLQAMSGAFDGTNDQFGENIINDSLYKKVNIPIEYSGATGAITELTSNNIGVLTISSEGICAFASKMRVRYVDG